MAQGKKKKKKRSIKANLCLLVRVCELWPLFFAAISFEFLPEDFASSSPLQKKSHPRPKEEGKHQSRDGSALCFLPDIEMIRQK